MNPIPPADLTPTQAGYAGFHRFIDDNGYLPDSENYSGPFETPPAAFIDARESGS